MSVPSAGARLQGCGGAGPVRNRVAGTDLGSQGPQWPVRGSAAGRPRGPRAAGCRGEATHRITAADARVRVLILTTFDLDEYAFGALRAGASGFLLKDVRPAELVAAIRTVAAGDAVVSPRVTRRLLEEYAQVLPLAPGQREQQYPQLAALTEREREVLIAGARGLSNTEIAASLFVSEATVKSHVGRILSKLGLRDRVQVVVLAYEAGLIQPGAR